MFANLCNRTAKNANANRFSVMQIKWACSSNVPVVTRGFSGWGVRNMFGNFQFLIFFSISVEIFHLMINNLFSSYRPLYHVVQPSDNVCIVSSWQGVGFCFFAGVSNQNNNFRSHCEWGDLQFQLLWRVCSVLVGTWTDSSVRYVSERWYFKRVR